MTKHFSLDGLFTKYRVVDIYDGDTCTCVITFKDSMYKFNVRLADIDTCEMKSNDTKNKELAKKAKLILYQLITNDMSDQNINISRKALRDKFNTNLCLINIKCGKFEKYGRLLGWLYNTNNVNKSIVELSINHQLVREHLAYFYDGSTKLSNNDQVNIMNQ